MPSAEAAAVAAVARLLGALAWLVSLVLNGYRLACWEVGQRGLRALGAGHWLVSAAKSVLDLWESCVG